MQAEQIARTASSAAALEKRRRALQAKQELLVKTVEQALEALHVLPEEEYFNLLVKMAAANAEPGEGEMLLSERDKSRCPKDFESRLSSELPAGAKLHVSDKTRPIDGGFILRYGNIELNCSFRAIFDARREELTDSIRGILFP
ncbi:V-type proton ATPase subunit E [bioreactor metagenome]|uniref:V-type proton ATPase subunit E n=1 Tax=bioreactor metagenome TaxID=1076179 RepID=A0A645IGI8_9ZZZZ